MPAQTTKPPTSPIKKALLITLLIVSILIILGFLGIFFLGKFIYNNFSPEKTTAPVVEKVKATAERIISDNNFTTLKISTQEQALIARRTTKSPTGYVITNRINTPNFIIEPIEVGGQLNTPERNTQNQANQAKLAELLQAELSTLGLEAVDSYTQSAGGASSTTTVYKVSDKPDIVCNFTLEFVSFRCAHTLALETVDTLIEPLATQYATTTPIGRETILSVSPPETGDNGYEITVLNDGVNVRFFYRHGESQSWTMSKISLSSQSEPTCAEVKNDPSLVLALSGFSSEQNNNYTCRDSNNQSVPITTSI